jgi:hypothetical protein
MRAERYEGWCPRCDKTVGCTPAADETGEQLCDNCRTVTWPTRELKDMARETCEEYGAVDHHRTDIHGVECECCTGILRALVAVQYGTREDCTRKIVQRDLEINQPPRETWKAAAIRMTTRLMNLFEGKQ